ncbi:MAG: succinate dehydrogenase, cytochrome b556 subunit [Croceibacterium sp.]
MADRPLSPHVTIWKWSPAMLVSILHRASGDGMALVGLPVLLWWLAALASGPEAYARFARAADNPLGMVVLVGVSWAFFNHLCSGIRHFVLDMGAGYELNTNSRWSVGTIIGGVVLTAAFWAVLVTK